MAGAGMAGAGARVAGRRGWRGRCAGTTEGYYIAGPPPLPHGGAGATSARMMIRYPHGNVLLRDLGRDFPVVTYGEGVWLHDADGHRWLDGSSGAFVSSVGHGNTEVVASIAASLGKVGYVNGMQFTSEPTEALATRIVSHAPAGLDKAVFLASGSESIEAAIKFARQLWYDRGELQRDVVIARTPSYHGNTLYALSISGRPHYKKVYGPLLSDVVTISAPYPYRASVDDYAGSAEHYAAELEAAIVKAGPERVALFVAEPIIGSSAGASVPPPGYFAAMSAVCRKYGVLTLADEVLCGVGRCGHFFASNALGFEPDLLVFGKGIGGGYAALAGFLAKSAHVAEMQAGSGKFMHAQTYMHAPMMTAAGIAVMDYMDTHQVVANAHEVGEYLQRQLAERIGVLPHVGCMQGMGLLAGIELVANTATRAPFARTEKVAERVTARCFENGLLVWPNVGQADGTNGDLLMVAPPLIITREEVDELVDRLSVALRLPWETA
ncbi:MAG: adenosylmethionine-8-amino-7-oxononanoate aminotransferase [Bradymonadia bacterium]|jgi:adenosylmethionine-8-amino-7-oxononanoate aminotransferase